MKISCHCGAPIPDSTDGLPGKAHFIPDQRLFPLLDQLDAGVINAVADGQLSAEAAAMELRRVLGHACRRMWQCTHCGRLYIEDPSGQLRCFAPESDDHSRGVLRDSW